MAANTPPIPYSPQSGTNGDIFFGNVRLFAAAWRWDGSIKVMDCPSFPGGEWVDYSIGKKRLALLFTGVWDAGFNPFTVAMKLGFSARTILKVNSVVQAIAYDAVVARWIVDDDADGNCTYSCALIGSFVFGDFSGIEA